MTKIKGIQILMIKAKGVGVMYNLLKISEGSLRYKYNLIKKYYPIYLEHSIKQHHNFTANINYCLQHQNQQSYKTAIKQAYENYTKSLLQKINRKKQSFSENKENSKVNNTSLYQKQARNVLHQGMEYLSLYYESLQNIIQGRRQVLHDQGFIFQDGQSVEQKRLKFEKYLSKLLGRSRQEIQKVEMNSRKDDDNDDFDDDQKVIRQRN